MKILIVLVAVATLAGCAGRGNHILKEVPSVDRIMREMPQL